MCVKGLVVRAQYALPSVCMVVRSRYLLTNNYFSEGIIVHAWYVLPSVYLDCVVSMWCAHEKRLNIIRNIKFLK